MLYVVTAKEGIYEVTDDLGANPTLKIRHPNLTSIASWGGRIYATEIHKLLVSDAQRRFVDPRWTIPNGEIGGAITASTDGWIWVEGPGALAWMVNVNAQPGTNLGVAHWIVVGPGGITFHAGLFFSCHGGHMRIFPARPSSIGGAPPHLFEITSADLNLPKGLGAMHAIVRGHPPEPMKVTISWARSDPTKGSYISQFSLSDLGNPEALDIKSGSIPDMQVARIAQDDKGNFYAATGPSEKVLKFQLMEDRVVTIDYLNLKSGHVRDVIWLPSAVK